MKDYLIGPSPDALEPVAAHPTSVIVEMIDALENGSYVRLGDDGTTREQMLDRLRIELVARSIESTE
jgi:hypothetical protein